MRKRRLSRWVPWCRLVTPCGVVISQYARTKVGIHVERIMWESGKIARLKWRCTGTYSTVS